MSDFEDDDREHEEMLRKHRERLQEAAKKYSVELDNHQKQTTTSAVESKKKQKYDNPFERNTLDDDDFNDRDLDFMTDDIAAKPRPKVAKRSNITFGQEEQSVQKQKEAKVKFEDETEKQNLAVTPQKPDSKSRSPEHPLFTDPENDYKPKPLSYTEEDEMLSKKIKDLLNSESSEHDNDIVDSKPHPEMSYQDILQKYKKLTDELDDLEVPSHARKTSQGFAEKEELEKSIKLAEDEILKYKNRLQQSIKEDEESQGFRQSLESDKFKYFLTASYGDKELTEPDQQRYVHHDTLEYSATSRRGSEFKGVMETENDESYRSYDESVRKIDHAFRNSPRVDSRFKEVKSPLSSRRNSSERKKQSPRGQSRYLGSPAENQNIVYDKFVTLSNEKDNKARSKDKDENNYTSNQSRDKKESALSARENQISPLRGRNLAKNDISKLSIVNEENISRELTPSKQRRTLVGDKMSPMRIPELQQKIEHFSPVPFSQRNRSPYRPAYAITPERNKAFRSPGLNADDEVLPSFEDFQKIMKDVSEVTGNLRSPSREQDYDTAHDKRYDIEYQSIQETLRSIKELKMSNPRGLGDFNVRRSDQEMDLDYSMTSDNFSRDDNPLEDASAIFRSVEKYGADDTISMLTYKSPERDTLRSTWKRSSEANAFLIFKDRSILELLSVYEKAKGLRDKSSEIEQSIEKIDYLFNRLRYLNSKNRSRSPVRNMTKV